MADSISLIEIYDSLRPCPLCGRKVNIRQIKQNYDGSIKAEIECFCGLSAELTYYPPEVILFEGDIRNRLLPWEQWNRRYDDA